MSVGKASSDTALPLLCFKDRLEYRFVHDRHGTVDMVMYFADMCDVVADQATGNLSFHIVTPLDMFQGTYGKHANE